MNRSAAPTPTLPPPPSTDYQAAPTRSQLDQLTGPVVLDFGTNWCGFCRVARPLVDVVLAGHPGLRHLRIEDGPGRPLGRAFGVKLWPTLVFLADGRETGRLVRPSSQAMVEEAVTGLSSPRPAD